MQPHSTVVRLGGRNATRGADLLSQLRWFLLVALAVALVIAGARQAYGAPPNAAPPSAGNSSAAPPNAARGYILVGKKPTSSRADFLNAVNAQGAHSIGTLGSLNVDVVGVPPGHEAEHVARLQHNPNVEFAELDQVMQAAATVNDPLYSGEWHLPKISAPLAWDTTLGAGVTIAILDTGVDGTHPDLAAHMVAGYNFYDGNTNTSDVNGHGTAVAGAAAAVANNATGVAGVAGGAYIMPIRIADPSAYTLWSTAAQGINYAADHGARVVNMSYIGAAASSTIQSAASYLRSKGGVLFVAAGNTGAIDNTPPTTVMQVVSATDENDQLASFSTYGSFVTISAPGNNIYTTAMGGSYQYWWGTSLATPVAAATAALIIARRPDFTPAQIDSTLEASATDLGPTGTDIYFGAGRVNAGAAVALAGGSSPADTTPPTVAISAPTGGTVSGTVSVSVSASDNVGVTRVDLRVNGATVATDTSAPWSFSWNSATVADGSVTLTAVAYDAAGNSATSAPVTLNVSNAPAADTTPPTVSIASPAAGATVSGTVVVSVNASDNVGVSRVDFRVNGSTVATSNAAPYQFAWSTVALPNGGATLTAVAYDAAGNSATSAAVGVTVSNLTGGTGGTDTTPPVVAITNPVNGALVNGNVSIQASASDNSGAAGITQRLYIDGILKATATGATLTYTWNAKRVSSGTHTIVVTATDAAGNASSATVQVRRK